MKFARLRCASTSAPTISVESPAWPPTSSAVVRCRKRSPAVRLPRTGLRCCSHPPSFRGADMPDPVAAVSGNGDDTQTLIVVFLRGAADGLTLVPPVEDENYYRARPRISVAKQDAIPLDGF